ncbi:MAG: TonB-dependent receptor plug domain-containing protein, partial [Nevskia sp.]|nr:TonB-dependent receptor plug domain-containing protein [Nevskia sp.]
MPSRNKLRKSGLNLRDATKDLTAALAILVPTGMAYAQTAAPPAAPAAEEASPPGEASVLSDMVVNASAIPSIASEAVGGAGFAKPLLETPRAVSLINEDTLNLLGINAIEDIVRAVPGTYTTTRYGLQGGINVRGIPADVYWRGMKRITAQGHYRTDLSSLSSMEIVKGAAPPIFGLGRIGGYVNQTPRSGGKAQTGTYLTDLSGFVQGVVGSFEKLEATTGVGGPVDVAGKQGGFYTYGLVENSGTYVRQVNVRQRLIQSALSLNNIGIFRVESGFQAQNSQTSGGYMNRVTQGLVDSGQYVRGSPLKNLDVGAGANLDGAGDGFIGQRELHANTGVTGTVSAANRPLDQRFNWPKCSGPTAAPGADPRFAGPGGFCLPGHFPVQPGIPIELFNYLEANPNKDPTGEVRAARALGNGVAPASGVLPIGFFLDPTTTGFADVDYRRNGSYERLQNA